MSTVATVITIAEAIQAISVASASIVRAQQGVAEFSALVARAHAEGRTEISDAELDQLELEDDAVREQFKAAIAARRAAG